MFVHANFVMTAVGFEPTQLALVELESTPLDHSGQTVAVHDPPNAFPSPLVHGAAAALTVTSPAGQPQARAPHLS